MKNICFYYHHINSIGGVEIAILNLIEKLHKYYKITDFDVIINNKEKTAFWLNEFKNGI